MTTQATVSFTSGELSPLVDARSDFQKYSAGCRRLENMIPRVYGAAIRRPGTQYIYTSKTTGKQVRLIPFDYSATNAYVCEFGEYYVRFYYDGGIVESGGSPVEVVTPYTEAQLAELQCKQINDVLFITHRSHSPATLSRTSSTVFVYKALQKASTSAHDFAGGPFLTENAIAAHTITPSSTTGSITLTASTDMFDDDHVGSLWQLRHAVTLSAVDRTAMGHTPGDTSSAVTVLKGQQLSYKILGDSSHIGTLGLQRSYDGSTWDTFLIFPLNSNETSEATITEDVADAAYRWVTIAWTQGNAYIWLSTVGFFKKGVVQITAVTDITHATATVIETLGAAAATYMWSQGAWSDYQGWPRSMTIFQERAIYGGTTRNPKTLWMSHSGDYYDFLEGTNDADAFILEIASDLRVDIQWLTVRAGVAIGTSLGLYRLAGSINNPVMTPTNYDLSFQSGHECYPRQSLQATETILYVDRTARHIYELIWEDARQAYVSTPATLLCEHLTDGDIGEICFQRNPEPIIWFLTSTSPYLFSLTYNKSQDVIAGAKHPMTNGVIESICRIPGSSEDEIWMSVKRTVGGTDYRYIERMKAWDFGDQEDAWFLDSALSTTLTGPLTPYAITNSATATITMSVSTLSNGDQVRISDAAGMTEINGLVMTVKNKTTVTGKYRYDLYDSTGTVRVDTSGFGTYTTGAVLYQVDNSFSGLDHLEGETVTIFGDGAYLGTAEVTSGAITLDTDIWATQVVAGLPYTYLLKPMRLDAQPTHRGATKRISRLVLSLYETLGLQYGRDEDHLYDVVFEQDPLEVVMPMYTGDVTLAFDGQYSAEDDLILTGSQPLPCTIRAIVVALEGYDV